MSIDTNSSSMGSRSQGSNSAVSSLKDKVALLTSSSPGTCVEIAVQLAQAGAKVVICGRNANQGLATVRQIRAHGGRATFILADIAVVADVKAMIDEAIATYGRLDILINNISNSYAQDASVPDVSEAVWDRIMEPLLKGTFFCCQLAIPFLQQYQGGTIINLIDKTLGVSSQAVADICQGGVVAMTTAIAQQFNTSNVTANMVWATPLSAQTLAGSQTIDKTQLGLIAGEVLTHSAQTQLPFVSIREAVMYLAQQGHTLHGTALLVQTPESSAASSSMPSSTRS